MIEIRDCDNYEAAKELILEYSKIKGAEACFVSLNKELADLEGFYKDGALLLGYDGNKPVATAAIKRTEANKAIIHKARISRSGLCKTYDQCLD